MALFKPYKILESQLDQLPIQDGQVIYTTDSGKIFLDNGENRISVGGNSNSEDNSYKIKVFTTNEVGKINSQEFIKYIEETYLLFNEEHTQVTDIKDPAGLFFLKDSEILVPITVEAYIPQTGGVKIYFTGSTSFSVRSDIENNPDEEEVVQVKVHTDINALDLDEEYFSFPLNFSQSGQDDDQGNSNNLIVNVSEGVAKLSEVMEVINAYQSSNNRFFTFKYKGLSIPGIVFSEQNPNYLPKEPTDDYNQPNEIVLIGNYLYTYTNGDGSLGSYNICLTRSSLGISSELMENPGNNSIDISVDDREPNLDSRVMDFYDTLIPNPYYYWDSVMSLSLHGRETIYDGDSTSENYLLHFQEIYNCLTANIGHTYPIKFKNGDKIQTYENIPVLRFNGSIIIGNIPIALGESSTWTSYGLTRFTFDYSNIPFGILIENGTITIRVGYSDNDTVQVEDGSTLEILHISGGDVRDSIFRGEYINPVINPKLLKTKTQVIISVDQPFYMETGDIWAILEDTDLSSYDSYYPKELPKPWASNEDVIYDEKYPAEPKT